MADNLQRIEELKRELASNPASRQFYQLGELLRREGRHQEAAEVLRAGIAFNPRYVAAWVALGRAWIEVESPARAAEALEGAIALDRQNPVAWRLLGEAKLAAGDRLGALAALGQALELVPGDEVLQSAVEALAGQTAPPADGAASPGPPPAPAAAIGSVPLPTSAAGEATEVETGPEAVERATAAGAEVEASTVDAAVGEVAEDAFASEGAAEAGPVPDLGEAASFAPGDGDRETSATPDGETAPGPGGFPVAIVEAGPGLEWGAAPGVPVDDPFGQDLAAEPLAASDANADVFAEALLGSDVGSAFDVFGGGGGTMAAAEPEAGPAVTTGPEPSPEFVAGEAGRWTEFVPADIDSPGPAPEPAPSLAASDAEAGAEAGAADLEPPIAEPAFAAALPELAASLATSDTEAVAEAGAADLESPIAEPAFATALPEPAPARTGDVVADSGWPEPAEVAAVAVPALDAGAEDVAVAGEEPAEFAAPGPATVTSGADLPASVFTVGDATDVAAVASTTAVFATENEGAAAQVDTSAGATAAAPAAFEPAPITMWPESGGRHPEPLLPATVTMARVLIQQHDFAAAVEVLERTVAREPGNQEAADLLELVRDMMVPDAEPLPPLSVRERKIAALQRWLASLTLGGERVAS